MRMIMEKYLNITERNELVYMAIRGKMEYYLGIMLRTLLHVRDGLECLLFDTVCDCDCVCDCAQEVSSRGSDRGYRIPSRGSDRGYVYGYGLRYMVPCLAETLTGRYTVIPSARRYFYALS